MVILISLKTSLILRKVVGSNDIAKNVGEWTLTLIHFIYFYFFIFTFAITVIELTATVHSAVCRAKSLIFKSDSCCVAYSFARLPYYKNVKKKTRSVSKKWSNQYKQRHSHTYIHWRTHTYIHTETQRHTHTYVYI